MSKNRDWTVMLIVIIIVGLGTAPLWLWALDAIFHFGFAYGG